MKRKVHVNDQLSPNSIFLVGNVTGNEVVFLRDPVFVHVLDATLQSIFGTSSEDEIFGYYRNPTKNPGTLRIKMSRLFINLKNLAGIEYSYCLVQNLSPFSC